MKTKSKSTIKLWLTLIIVFIGYSNYGQQGSAIIGTWVLDYNSTILSISGTDKEKYDAMGAEAKLNVHNFYYERQYVFNADGTYVIANGNTLLQQGSWSVSTAGDKLYFSATTGDNLICGIGSSGSNLVLHLEGSGTENALLKHWHLIAIP